MQDAEHVVVDEVCVPGVDGTLDVSILCSTFLEVIVMDFFLALLLDPGIDGELNDSLLKGWFACTISDGD